MYEVWGCSVDVRCGEDAGAGAVQKRHDVRTRERGA